MAQVSEKVIECLGGRPDKAIDCSGAEFSVLLAIEVRYRWASDTCLKWETPLYITSAFRRHWLQRASSSWSAWGRTTWSYPWFRSSLKKFKCLEAFDMPMSEWHFLHFFFFLCFHWILITLVNSVSLKVFIIIIIIIYLSSFIFYHHFLSVNPVITLRTLPSNIDSHIFLIFLYRTFHIKLIMCIPRDHIALSIILLDHS